ncbi:MAG: YoaK family protein [Isosphaeraceae bacterium]
MQVTLHTPATIYTARHIPSWLLLAAAPGFVNGFAFLTCQQYVTHVTGTVTRAGLEVQNVGIAAEYLIVYVSFLVGAAAAVIVAQWRAREGCPDRWISPLFGVAMVLATVALVGHFWAFIPIGSRSATDPPPVFLLSLLAFASGLQNATVASTTSMSVRTTHLTGPTTDIGMLLGAAWMSTGTVRRSVLAGAALRGGMVLSFAIGAALSVMTTAWAGYLALLIPTGFVLVAGGLSFIPRWSASDIPFSPEGAPPPPPGELAGLPSDARPDEEEVRKEKADALADR